MPAFVPMLIEMLLIGALGSGVKKAGSWALQKTAPKVGAALLQNALTKGAATTAGKGLASIGSKELGTIGGRSLGTVGQAAKGLGGFVGDTAAYTVPIGLLASMHGAQEHEVEMANSPEAMRSAFGGIDMMNAGFIDQQREYHDAMQLISDLTGGMDPYEILDRLEGGLV